MSAFNIDELIAVLGPYCRENRDIIVSEILLDEKYEEKFEVLDDVTDEVPLPSLNIADIVQPGNALQFNPTSNALKFGARMLKVRPCKVDLLLVPSLLEKSWLGKRKSSKNPLEIPFEQFIMTTIIAKARENIHLKGLWKGVYNPAGTTTADTMDGVLTIINREVVDGKIIPFVTGNITPANVIDAVEGTFDALGDAYKALNTQMIAAPNICTMYHRARRKNFGGNTDYTGITALIEGTNCLLKPEPGMSGSKKLITSVQENFVLGVDTMNDYNIDVQKENRTIKILIDFKIGPQLKEIHNRALSVNDQP